MNTNISILFANIKHNGKLNQCGCSLSRNLDEVRPNLKFDVMWRSKSLVVGEINMDFTDGHWIADVYVAGIQWCNRKSHHIHGSVWEMCVETYLRYKLIWVCFCDKTGELDFGLLVEVCNMALSAFKSVSFCLFVYFAPTKLQLIVWMLVIRFLVRLVTFRSWQATYQFSRHHQNCTFVL